MLYISCLVPSAQYLVVTDMPSYSVSLLYSFLQPVIWEGEISEIAMVTLTFGERDLGLG